MDRAYNKNLTQNYKKIIKENYIKYYMKIYNEYIIGANKYIEFFNNIGTNKSSLFLKHICQLLNLFII